MLVKELRNRFTADATANGDVFDRDGAKGDTLTLNAQYKPVGTAPSGTTIAFDAKTQHSIDKVTWADVPGGGITTIAVGTEARASKQLDLNAVALFQYLRIVGITSITGVPNYQTGTDLIARVHID